MTTKLPPIAPIELGQDKVDLDYFLGHDYQDISAASMEIPALLEWVNSWLQAYLELKEVKKVEVEEVEAKAYFDMCNGLFEDRGYAGKKTATAISHAVILEDSVKAAKREYANINAWCCRLYGLQASLQAKLDLVRSSESTRRKIFDAPNTATT